MRTITETEIASFEHFLWEEEKSAATVGKYLRDVRAFAAWLSGRESEKSLVLAYKAQITENYAPQASTRCCRH